MSERVWVSLVMKSVYPMGLNSWRSNLRSRAQLTLNGWMDEKDLKRCLLLKHTIWYCPLTPSLCLSPPRLALLWFYLTDLHSDALPPSASSRSNLYDAPFMTGGDLQLGLAGNFFFSFEPHWLHHQKIKVQTSQRERFSLRASKRGVRGSCPIISS